MPFGQGAPTFPHRLLQVACGYEAGVCQLASVTPKRINQSVGLPTRTDLRIQCQDGCQLRDNRDVVDLVKARLVSAKGFGDLLQLLTHHPESLDQRRYV